MPENKEIIKFLKRKDYEVIKDNLGSGAFGKTKLIKDPFIDELFVVKKYEPYFEDIKEKFYDCFLKEIKIMYRLNHPNIVRIYNYYPYETEYTGYIIMEYIDGKNIKEYLEHYIPWIDEDPNDIFVQLIDGFKYLESQGILHRDIREGNILVDNNGIVKIIDFGLGKTFEPEENSSGDSKVEYINRAGLDCLPEEFFVGLSSRRIF